MLNSGKKFALCATKKINILTRVVREKKFWTKKTHSPPCKLNGRSLNEVVQHIIQRASEKPTKQVQTNLN